MTPYAYYVIMATVATITGYLYIPTVGLCISNGFWHMNTETAIVYCHGIYIVPAMYVAYDF